MNEDIAMVPFAAYESLAARFTRIIKCLIIGWACSVFALGLVLVISLSYTEEVVTETTTHEVEQEADNYGSNTFAGGDYYDSKANGQDYGYDYEDYDTAGSELQE